MAFHDIGRIGQMPDGRKRRRQAIILVGCASACWGLVALLYYCFALTETYWP